MGDETKGFVNGQPVDGFRLDVENRVRPEFSLRSYRSMNLIESVGEVTAEITIDVGSYPPALADRNLFTIEKRIDLNPHHRTAHGFRARLRRARSIMHWHWRKLIRKPLSETCVVTIPDVKAENITIAGPSSPSTD